jgi:hypothetical protein
MELTLFGLLGTITNVWIFVCVLTYSRRPIPARPWLLYPLPFFMFCMLVGAMWEASDHVFHH